MLDDVAWDQLSHAYGAAGDVPGWLRAVPDELLGARALDDLAAAILHQGGAVCSAGAAAVPFLVALARDPVVPHRPAVLELVGRFAALLHELPEPWRSEPEAVECGGHLRAATGELIGLAGDADPDVRVAAARVVAELRHAPGEVVEALGRAAGDPVERVRAAAVLALGELAPHLDAGARAHVRRRLAPEPAPLTVLVARNRLDPGSVGPGRFVAALENPAVEHRRGAPGLLVWIGTEIGRAPAVRDARAWLARYSLTTTDSRIAGSAIPLEDVGAAMLRWRSVTADLVPDLVPLLDDAAPERRAGAAHLLAAAGEPSRPHAGRLAVAVGDQDRAVRARAVWALARLADPRAVAPVAAAIRGRSDLFAASRTYQGGHRYEMSDVPGLLDVLIPMAPHAAALLPAVRDATDPPVVRAMTEVLAAYGPAAAPAVPELIAMLGTDRTARACEALAAIGPAAGAAAATLATLGSVEAAWALFRVTGDPGPLLALIDVGGHRNDQATLGVRLAALGPLAARHAGAVAEVLTAKPRSWATWNKVELAYAYHRMTGDTMLCLDVFAAALAPVREGRQLPVTRQVLRHLAGMPVAAAARFEPELRTVVTTDERLEHSGGWRGIVEDDEARDLAIQVLRRGGAGAW